MTKIIAISNQKGGVGKTTTTITLGAGLVQQGKEVLLIDFDPQGNMTSALGVKEPDELTNTISYLMDQELKSQPILMKDTIHKHNEGMDFIPCNINLASIDAKLVNTFSREKVLKRVLSRVKNKYDYILIDCLPTINLLNINALTAATDVIIPVQAEHLSIMGLRSLLDSVKRVKRELNRKLNIEGIVITMTDNRTNLSKIVEKTIRDNLGNSIHIFAESIPRSVRVAESSLAGCSVVQTDPHGKATKAYQSIVMEVLMNEEKSIRKLHEKYRDR